MTDCPRPDKKAHKSFTAAMKAREAFERENGVDLSLRPYRCACGSWHLGRRDQTPRRFRKLRGPKR